MSDWGRRTYGDPCRECGYRWSIDQSEAIALIRSTPDQYSQLLGNSDGTTHIADLTGQAARTCAT